MLLIEQKPHENDNYNDRRIFARVNAQVVLRCKEGEENPNPGVTVDISAQGLGFVSYEEIKPEAQVRIQLKLPYSEEEFVTVGTIIWCIKVDDQKFRIGVALEKPELMLVSQLLNGLAQARLARRHA
jgi:hypothetical protein